MTIETKTIINMSLQALMVEFQEHVQQGWEMDLDHPIGLFGIAHEMGLVRNDKTIATLLKASEGKPVLSRAEILANAREAKRLKNLQAGVQ